jgi:DHA2 family multidrug resistance protein
VPITTQAYGTLRNDQIGNASGIFNLVRNIGGSVGISVAQTLLTRRSDFHQNQIVNSMPLSGYWFEQRASQLARYLGNKAGPANGAGAAQGQLYHQLGQQSLLWAFVDVFRWMALLCFACVALVWLFKKVQPGKKAPAGAH